MERIAPAGMPASASRPSQWARSAVPSAFSMSAMSSSRWANRCWFVAYRGSEGSMPRIGASLRHWVSLPQAIWIMPSAQRNAPYGAIEAWWLPWAFGTTPPTVHAVPW